MKPRTKPWLTASLCASLLVAACGGGSGGGGEPPPPTGTTPTPTEGALRAARPGDLVSYFKERIAQRSAQGLDATRDTTGVLTAAPAPTAGPVGTAGTGAAETSTAYSGTQLQEAGVDEDDLLKTDGSFVYALTTLTSADGRTASAPQLAASRIQADGSLSALGTATLSTDFYATGMYLMSSANRVAVLGRRQWYGDVQPATTLLPYPMVSPEVSIDLFEVSGSAAPAPRHRIVFDGNAISTRMIGSVLYVASTWTPQVSIYRVPPNATIAQVQAALANLSTTDLVPTVRVDGGAAQPLVAESDCMLQPANASLSLQLTTVTAIDLSSPTLARASRCFVGDGSGLYMSPSSVYIASSRQFWMASMTAAAILPQQTATDIHKFALNGLQIDYRGSGEVTGHLGWDVEKLPYRMSEHQGLLRVLSYTGQSGWWGPVIQTTTVPTTQPSPATLTILREDSSARRLVAVSTLPNAQRPAPLGHAGEQVYAMHFAGPQAYLVTFRRTDPLYVLDLSNAADPRTVGELAVPGFSDYLFPLAGGKLLGVGKEATADGMMQGLKLSLFDVSNPAQPRVLASRTLGQRGSVSALDYSRHGINLFEQGGNVRVALPVRVTADVWTATRPQTSVQGLARYTVDTAAGTLTERPMIVAARFDGSNADWPLYTRYNLTTERSVQTAAGVYYLSGGTVSFTRE